MLIAIPDVLDAAAIAGLRALVGGREQRRDAGQADHRRVVPVAVEVGEGNGTVEVDGLTICGQTDAA